MWYHVSLEPVREFIPRIPKLSAPGEDKETPRICVSSSVDTAFRAAPQMGNILRALLDNGIIPVVYLYRFYMKEYGVRDYLPPFAIKDKVPDAIANREFWLLKPPKRVSCTKLLIHEDSVILKETDMYGTEEYFCEEMFIWPTKSKITVESQLDRMFGEKEKGFLNKLWQADVALRLKLGMLIDDGLIPFKDGGKMGLFDSIAKNIK